MVEYLLLAEKESAAKHFEKAFGGMSGRYAGHTFKIVRSQGHLLTFKEPTEMLKDNKLISKYQSWDIKDLPWDSRDLNWQRTYNSPSSSKLLKNIKQASQSAEIFVIATDNDPSGEGELIGWEIVNAINWRGKVGRMYFDDESIKSLQKAFEGIKILPAQLKDGDYLKAESRSRWDYLSMQLTRACTDVARKANYGVKSVRQGRLKSVI
ncbi:type IA DNA topoisomerase, partial [Lactobacillus sp. XV13L]|nr:type IA DNA topoisomerase [Lactobacillus sp. XV13L]